LEQTAESNLVKADLIRSGCHVQRSLEHLHKAQRISADFNFSGREVLNEET